MTRRGFVSTVGSAVATSACAGITVFDVMGHRGRVEVPLADVAELQNDRPVMLRVGEDGVPLLVARMENGMFAVVSAICSHLGCTIRSVGKGLVCPCHGSSFTWAGVVTHGPATKALRTYANRVIDDVLQIELHSGGTQS